MRIEFEGVENIPLDKGCILAANHRSNLDPFVLNTVSPRPILFMAKQELFGVPLLGWFIKKAGAIPVKRNKRDIASLKKAVELIKDGHCIGIFPEGARAKPGEFRKPQSGVGLLVSKTEAPVVPIRIEGTDIVYPVGSKIPKIGKSKIYVKVGKPLTVDSNMEYSRISEYIMEEIKRL
ncbi:lysophospholipid acyltransferase family protein [Persephonella hydrogeniphila]|uniref:lysophospholipid acyltransferase family protein n=1 Tax=Persephonella hydrogeniphila TaxID=198703 RepID=UPI001FE7546B|nr:lysophospholipid acyltransferase family protein [Persephonella hydrogeniphila]